MNEGLYFEDIEIGTVWVSQSRTITETDVVMFAGLTGDFNALHMDREFARQSPFGKPIAHGLLGVSLVAGLGSHAPLVKTDAFVAIREWAFLKPIFIGDTVHVHTEAVEKDESGRRRGRVLWKRQLKHHHGAVLQSGIFEALVAKRVPQRRAES